MAHQWEMHTLRLQAAELPAQPADVDLSVTWESDGRSIVVPGFWNGETEYLVRFTPPQSGEWRYKTQSSLPALNDLTGALSVEAAQASSAGGIQIHPQHSQRFSYQNGDTYFPIAYECDWLFALDAENPDDIPLTRMLVDEIAESGFNQVVLNVFAYDVNWPKDPNLRAEHEYGSPSVFPFEGTNEEPEHDKLNIEYFKRFDRVVEYLEEQGMVAHIMIYVWNKRVNWPMANSREDNRYFDYVVKRYQAYPNVVWDISKEALGYGHNDVNYITDRIHRLRGLDAHKRLVTVHDYGYCRRFPSELDFVSVQLWSSELYSVMRKTISDFPDKPILNIEHGGYERGPYRVFVGDYTSPETCLERAYQCVFAGTFPTHYWQGSAWNVIIADIDSLPETEQPRLQYYKHLADLVDRFQLHSLVAGEKHSNSGFCLTNKRDLFVYYVPKENDSINLRLPSKLRDRMMRGTWFDPFTGHYSEPQRKKVVQWPSFDKPPATGFLVLIIQIEDDSKTRATD